MTMWRRRRRVSVAGSSYPCHSLCIKTPQGFANSKGSPTNFFQILTLLQFTYQRSLNSSFSRQDIATTSPNQSSFCIAKQACQLSVDTLVISPSAISQGFSFLQFSEAPYNTFTWCTKMLYFGSPLEAEIFITEKLKYLDLASGLESNVTIGPELKSNNLPLAVGRLDLSLPTNTILVPQGQTMTFNKTILKLKGFCGKFVLFPNLPNEIKSEIFDLCSLPPRQITFIEMEANGVHYMQSIGASRPAIFAASKPALLDALARKRYVPLATIDNKRKPYLGVGRDVVQLGSMTTTSPPILELADVLINKFDVSYIQTIHVSLNDLVMLYIWCATNLVFLPNVKVLHLTATFSDPGRAQRGLYTLWFREIWGSRNAFMPMCNTPAGDEVQCQAARDCFDTYICSPFEQGRIDEINYQLNCCLNRVPNFPLEVAVIVEYLPLPGFPLATSQPRIQQV
ncbi:hypothetical protein ONS95_000606 [Cadophora gregata]|uniref:uncharacterized protein n=1 Tax=Cadophora gregata TaxID=51156 RepID=UPI0026DC3E8C|nr:uncharacterized protein ONS95_000606 [Cadophora gregata]KAK0125374.1 hypothetical protein ONS96_009222 [Cadophora gregata f. sp. sojae]KAK0128646.1 hypothetical protein ONS95_000606 [Cadophora gregata]